MTSARCTEAVDRRLHGGGVAEDLRPHGKLLLELTTGLARS